MLENRFHTIAFGTIVVAACLAFGTGCSTIDKPLPHAVSSPLKVIVGPVTLEATITKSTQIYSFEQDPDPEQEQLVFPQLVEEVRTKTQRMLIEQLARRPEFSVVPFEETRRMMTDHGPQDGSWTTEQLQALGKGAGADMVISGRILDYGRVRWQYWVTGWLAHVTVATTIVGLATAWNPAVVGAYLLVDASTDLPLWWGGAQIFGFAFRPVRVEINAMQIQHCPGPIWSEQELKIKVPGKDLEKYSKEEQGRKEIQLEINLEKATLAAASSVAEKLRLQACTEDGTPEQIEEPSILRVLDLLY